MANKKKEEEPQSFVVTDRRRFSEDGEAQTPAPAQEETTSPEPASVAAAPAPPPPAPPAAPEAPPPEAAEMEPLTAEDRAAGHRAYQESTHALDDQLRQQVGAEAVADEFKVSIERVIEPFYVTTMMQLGLLGQEGAERRVDIIGARQTIDTLHFLLEKTKGNLTAVEHELFENVIYQLRMSYLEITNALAKAVQNPAGGVPNIPKA
jgi:hypothetical protein